MECDVCGYTNCTKLAHTTMTDFGYVGTFDELRAVASEIRDIRTQQDELERQLKLLHEHRAYILRLMNS